MQNKILKRSIASIQKKIFSLSVVCKTMFCSNISLTYFLGFYFDTLKALYLEGIIKENRTKVFHNNVSQGFFKKSKGFNKVLNITMNL